MYFYWLCVVCSDILPLTFTAFKDPLWWWMAVSLREHWLNHQLEKKDWLTVWNGTLKTLKNYFHMLCNLKIERCLKFPWSKYSGNAALPCFSGFLCLTWVPLFAAAEHRGLCEDEFHSQHLEACLMIIKSKMNYSLKWQGEGYAVV